MTCHVLGSYGGGFSDHGGQSSQAGGYFNSPGNMGQVGSPSTGGPKAKRAQNLIPCTIAQVLQATQVDEHFKIGEVEINQVSIVGLIRQVEIAATNILYKVDDRTGPLLDIRQWIDNDENTPEELQPQVYSENTYIKVIGNIRTFGGKRSISPFKIKPLTDLNELTLHMLETVHTHMLLTKRKSLGASTSGTFGTHQFMTPSKGGMASTSGYGAVTTANGLNSVQAEVHRLITACPDDQGVSINFLATSLKGTPYNKIKDALEFLSNEGHIYSTIDDDHFKSTDG
ncbi:replication protein A 32 kDa subunit-like isoform X2 [Acanthaster planci]|uniref:Replication protein A 32 kDa subunit-like isoform X2 n=1 Tax=Acanthaster planci TaxID=133434 RepID=A0A8B7YF40_ACAPL|nr:replication protein A 32 kDa subunit-like isoform X2 [Acanthaster planci]